MVQIVEATLRQACFRQNGFVLSEKVSGMKRSAVPGGKDQVVVYVPLSHEPGEVGQVDFGEAEVIIAGESVQAQLFVMWLGYSGSIFVKAYPGQTQEVFLDGQASAFEFYGGCRGNWGLTT